MFESEEKNNRYSATKRVETHHFAVNMIAREKQTFNPAGAKASRA